MTKPTLFDPAFAREFDLADTLIDHCLAVIGEDRPASAGPVDETAVLYGMFCILARVLIAADWTPEEVRRDAWHHASEAAAQIAAGYPEAVRELPLPTPDLPEMDWEAKR